MFNDGSAYDEGTYCTNCDESFNSEDIVVEPVGELYERYKCPLCGFALFGLFLSDYGFLFQQYLLQQSEWDEDVGYCKWKYIAQ